MKYGDLVICMDKNSEQYLQIGEIVERDFNVKLWQDEFIVLYRNNDTIKYLKSYMEENFRRLICADKV